MKREPHRPLTETEKSGALSSFAWTNCPATVRECSSGYCHVVEGVDHLALLLDAAMVDGRFVVLP